MMTGTSIDTIVYIYILLPVLLAQPVTQLPSSHSRGKKGAYSLRCHIFEQEDTASLCFAVMVHWAVLNHYESSSHASYILNHDSKVTFPAMSIQWGSEVSVMNSTSPLTPLPLSPPLPPSPTPYSSSSSSLPRAVCVHAGSQAKVS